MGHKTISKIQVTTTYFEINEPGRRTPMRFQLGQTKTETLEYPRKLTEEEESIYARVRSDAAEDF